MEQKLQKKSIAIGLLVDIGLTILGGVGLSFVMGFIAGFRGIDLASISDMEQGVWFIMLSSIVGFLATIYGGYVAAKRAGFRHLEHAGWVGGVGLMLGVPVIVISMMLNAVEGIRPILSETISNVVYVVLAIPLALLGGYLARGRTLPTQPTTTELL